MEKPERSGYTPVDFLTWREANSLSLVPKFQRRGVWSTPARAFLIDTLLRGMPVPPIYLRTRQSDDKKRIIREVVDGQQRISSVLDFMDGKFALSKTLPAPYAGKWFSGLKENEQDAIRQYSFICEVMKGVSDSEILQVFSRLNTYSVPLNAQELRNGTYFGPFKQAAYGLGLEHIEFWRKHKIFAERRIARMLEAELTSELMIVMLDGFQDKKKGINAFYAKYDEIFKERSTIEARFRSTIDEVEDAVGDVLIESEFRRPPLFYSLFSAVYHHLHGIPKQNISSPKRRLNETAQHGLKTALATLSERIVAFREDHPVPKQYTQFVLACLRQTDNLQPRQIRFESLFREAFK